MKTKIHNVLCKRDDTFKYWFSMNKIQFYVTIDIANIYYKKYYNYFLEYFHNSNTLKNNYYYNNFDSCQREVDDSDWKEMTSED